MEEVALVDPGGNVIGTMAKAKVHPDTTPLHLAFCCYLRARGRISWPGVGTNSFCGHLQPAESFVGALGLQSLDAQAAANPAAGTAQ